MPRNNRRDEKGNAFVYVLIGIVLFAALMYTFTRSARQGGNNVSEQQIGLAVSDMTSYAQRLDRAVSRILTRDGMSESYISFQNPVSAADYTNAGCNGLTDPLLCKVFEVDGGGASWQSPPEGINDGSEWLFTGTNAVPNVGDDTAADLLLILPKISRTACLLINERLGVTNPGGDPPQDTDDIDTTIFTGTFANTDRVSDTPDINGDSAACIMNTVTSEYFFYAVLMAR